MPSFLTQTEGIIAQQMESEDVQDASSQTITVVCEAETQATPSVVDASAQTHAISPHALLWVTHLSEQEELRQAHERDNHFVYHSSTDESEYEDETSESDVEIIPPAPVIILQDAATQTVSDFTPPPPYAPPRRTELQRQFEEGYQLGYRQGYDLGYMRGQDPLTRGSSPFTSQPSPALLSFWEGYNTPFQARYNNLQRAPGQTVQEFASLVREEFRALTSEEYFESSGEEDTAIILPRAYSVD